MGGLRWVWVGLLAGVLMFAWGALSWMVLPFHQSGLLRFADERAVAAVVVEQAPTDGVYLLPNAHFEHNNTHPELSDGARADAMERMRAGPFAFVSVSLAGADPENPAPFLAQLVSQCLVGVLLAWLATHLAGGLGFWRRVGLLTAVAAVAVLAGLLPGRFWWGFSWAYVLPMVVDVMVSGFIAAWVCARWARVGD